MRRIILIEIVEIGKHNPEPMYFNVLEHNPEPVYFNVLEPETETPAHITQVLQELFDMVMDELKALE